jgi:CRISPR-associated endonuclease/helicase Cas3
MTGSMPTPLTVDDFGRFFREVHGHSAFPWQERLLQRVAAEGWPKVLDLPTGSGKTATLDVALFHLALDAASGTARKAPMRIAFVVDRRLVVDDAFRRAEKIANALQLPASESVVHRVAERLRMLAGKHSDPLIARQMRGGLPREESWARTPTQPVLLCSTVDQIGSRLLFRGYGISQSMIPVHAGLIGSDCLILLDEAHLSRPFRQTLAWVERYRGREWRTESSASPWNFVTLTATPESEDSDGSTFGLEDKDRANDVLKRRLEATKRARLVPVDKPRDQASPDASETGDDAVRKANDKSLVDILVSQSLEGLKDLGRHAVTSPALAVVVNRVARARAVFEEVKKKLESSGDDVEAILLIGPARQVERDRLNQRLDSIRTGMDRALERPLVIVATQCIEAGVDIDLDGLVTEAAPLDALRQRFGRLNRDGRTVSEGVPLNCFAAIVAQKSKDDPVYGDAIQETWEYLSRNPDQPSTKKQPASVDFGIEAFTRRIGELKADPARYSKLLSPKTDAPVLMPAHLDLLAQTSPIPATDPEVALYLHGPNRSADDVTIVWRSDIDPAFQSNAQMRRLLTLIPPQAAEAIQLPVWVVRKWLSSKGTRDRSDVLADIAVAEEESDQRRGESRGRPVFLWAGDEDRSQWIDARQIRPGSTIIALSRYGGVDEYGWKPDSQVRVSDVADEAREKMASRRYAVRVAPGLLGANNDAHEEALRAVLAAHEDDGWRNLRQAVSDAISSTKIHAALARLDEARSRGRNRVHFDLECYGRDEQGRPRGIVFLAPLGLKSEKDHSYHSKDGDVDSTASTEDDVAGSLAGFDGLLSTHSKNVADQAEIFATAAGLIPERIIDLRVAGLLHDAGKADRRFQAWLAYGDPLGPDPDSAHILAKSGRALPPVAREKSGLPARWRHEAFSVRLAPHIEAFRGAADQDLVLWLIGTHHGHGRPFFPHADPADDQPRTSLPQVLDIPSALAAGPGPQSLAYETDKGLDWSGLFEQLKARYGPWELARMEAILRLADHRASGKEQVDAASSASEVTA